MQVITLVVKLATVSKYLYEYFSFPADICYSEKMVILLFPYLEFFFTNLIFLRFY